MMGFEKFLLRTESQRLGFRVRYARYISDQSDAYVSWISRMPAREWIDYLSGVPEVNIPVVIGILCILYVDGRIDINFNNSATRIRRNWTDEEREAFWDSPQTLRPKRKRI